MLRTSMKKRKTPRKNSVVVFDQSAMNPEWWAKQSKKDLMKWYGPLGYGSKKLKFFVYLGDIVTAPGHCILIDMDTDEMITMRHTSDFREATEDEF